MKKGTHIRELHKIRKTTLNFRVSEEERGLIVSYFGRITDMRDFVIGFIKDNPGGYTVPNKPTNKKEER